MFQLDIARGFRAGINHTLRFAQRDGRFATIACRRLPFRNHEQSSHATNVSRRSFLNAAIKVQSSSSQPVCSARYFSTSSRHLSDDGDLIYTGNMGKAIVGVKMLCYSISGASLYMVSSILLKTGLENLTLTTIISWCSVGVLIFVTPAWVHLMTRSYVVRLYHNTATDTYTAVSHNVLLMEMKTVFHHKDVRVPAVKQMFTSFVAGQMPLMVSSEHFRSRRDYNHLMGYHESFVEDLDEPDD